MWILGGRRLPSAVAGLVGLLMLGACGAEPAPVVPWPVARAQVAVAPVSLSLPVLTLPSLIPSPDPPVAPTPVPSPTRRAPAVVHPAPSVDPPVATSMVLLAPSVGISTPILSVGVNRQNQMDAPKGPASSPIWDQAFWYHYGARPGQVGTATIAGHVNDAMVRPRMFSRIRQLHPGDPIEVQDTQSGKTAHFHVTEARAYSLGEAETPAVRNRTFGPYANTGRPEDRAAELASGVAHLTLITCTGTWLGGGFNQRFVVYAVRDN